MWCLVFTIILYLKTDIVTAYFVLNTSAGKCISFKDIRLYRTLDSNKITRGISILLFPALARWMEYTLKTFLLSVHTVHILVIKLYLLFITLPTMNFYYLYKHRWVCSSSTQSHLNYYFKAKLYVQITLQFETLSKMTNFNN